MYKGILHTHYLVVILFLLIYVIKTVLLLSNKNDVLAAFTKKIKVPEMIISTLFLATGIYLLIQLPSGGKYTYLLWIKLGMIAAAIPTAIIGFKKSNKILAALSLLLITGSFGIAESFHKRIGVAATDSTDAAAGNTDGNAIFQAKCVLCHGTDGKLGAAGAADLSTSALDKEGVKNIILNGKNTMAPVDISPEQADAVAAYVEANIKGK